jgi:predicted transposase/invertase (TIGR01784 family)
MKKQNFDDNSSNVNRNNKNSMFTSLFGNPEILRELYSAIEGIPIPPDIPIEINTLSGVLFLKQINDISFLIDTRLVVLIEHQSTICENLPLRMLEYTGRIYEKIVDLGKKYQRKLMKIPRPEFIVLYNGMEEYPDYSELKLSDAFMDVKGLKIKGIEKIPLELIAQVYNINQGHNPEILKKCETLANYSKFVDKLQEFQKKGIKLEESIRPVIEYCIKNNIMKKYLQEHGSEVYNMIFGDGEYDRDMDIAVNRREAWEDGREEGLEEGMGRGMEKGLEFTARNALAKGISVKTVQEITGLPLDRINDLTG